MLALVVAATIAVVAEQAPADVKVTYYLLEIVVGAIAGGFEIGLLRLLLYHLELTYSRLTTNEDLKGTYGPVSNEVPFGRCQPVHPPLVHE